MTFRPAAFKFPSAATYRPAAFPGGVGLGELGSAGHRHQSRPRGPGSFPSDLHTSAHRAPLTVATYHSAAFPTRRNEGGEWGAVGEGDEPVGPPVTVAGP
jgi:hypothetical protein